MNAPPTSYHPFVALLRLIRFSHTLFALPFALGAMFIAAEGMPSTRVFLLILAAMVSARTAAMLFNRWIDWEIDQRNPRTRDRHLYLPRSTVLLACLLASALFILSCFLINSLCFALSLPALGALFFYSLTKRFTSASHFFLGLALGLSPVGAWLAVTGTWSWTPLPLFLGVVAWVAGFDIIYASLDEKFDRDEGLHSLVVRWGVKRSRNFAIFLHFLLLFFLLLFGSEASLGLIYDFGVALMGVCLIFEHITAQKGDIASINRAFFTTNILVGAIFLTSTILDVFFPI